MAAAPEDTRTLRVIISGRVQGVCYRMWTQATAASLGLTGWVRNRYDGSVEALVHGPASSVQKMLHAFHEGPPAAAVTAVQTEEVVPSEPLKGFTIRSTSG